MITDAIPVRVGDTDLLAPRVGLGTAVLGNFLQAISDADAIAVIDRALASGVRYIDTAPLYGHGLAEQRAGLAIAGAPCAGLVLSTKVGRLLRAGAPRDETQYHDGISFYQDVPATGPVWDFSYDGVRRSVRESLERMGVGRFDVLHLHDPDDHLEQAATTAYRALRDLRAEGMVLAVGAGSNRSAPLTDLVRACDLDVVLLAGRYTLLDQTAMADLLPLCESRGVSVVIGGAFNSGVLIDPVPRRALQLPARRRHDPRQGAGHTGDLRQAQSAVRSCRRPVSPGAPAGVYRADRAADSRRARHGPVPVRCGDPTPALGGIYGTRNCSARTSRRRSEESTP